MKGFNLKMPSYHVNKNTGELVKCAFDPCKLHGGDDISADSLKDAEKIYEERLANQHEEDAQGKTKTPDSKAEQHSSGSKKRGDGINYRKYQSVSNNWRGNKNIRMGYYDDYNDPDLIYDGYEFNYYDMEDTMYSDYVDELKEDKEDGLIDSDEPTDEGFNRFVQDNAEGYFEDAIAGGYFKEGSKSWHDNYK